MPRPDDVDGRDRVEQLIEAGWTALLDGAIAASWWAIEWRAGRGKHRSLMLYVRGGRSIEVTVSPTGRSVRVFVDGNEVPPSS